jgi:hypothetical protein
LIFHSLHIPVPRQYGLQSELAHEVGPTHDEFSGDRGFDEGEHFFVMGEDRYAFDEYQGFL